MKRYSVVISGYYGSGNAGDEAILDAMVHLLLSSSPNLSLTVISVNPNDTLARHNCLNVISHRDPFAILHAIHNCHLLISGGGSLLQNVTSWRSLYYYLAIIALASLLGKKVMLFAQGFGPISGSFSRFLTSSIINNVDLITVRDHGSLLELANLGVNKPHIECTADPVLALQPVPLDFANATLDIKNNPAPLMIGVAVRHWLGFDHFKLDFANALDLIDDALSLPQRPVRFVFIPMQFPADVTAAQEIASLSKADCSVLSQNFSTPQLLSLVGCMDLLIGVRLHALIFAGVMQVPMVGVSYDPKVERFLSSIGEVPAADLSSFHPQALVKAVLEKLAAEGGCYDLSELSALARRNADLALGLLSSL